MNSIKNQMELSFVQTKTDKGRRRLFIIWPIWGNLLGQIAWLSDCRHAFFLGRMTSASILVAILIDSDAVEFHTSRRLKGRFINLLHMPIAYFKLRRELAAARHAAAFCLLPVFHVERHHVAKRSARARRSNNSASNPAVYELPP